MKKISEYTALLVIFIMGMAYHQPYLDEFPSYVHAWAQSDRYALAVGFENNNYNLFKPETYIMNPQFPSNWEVAHNQSTTAVDFPIHEYFISFFMGFAGSHSPWVFRLYILIFSFFGLFYLFRLAYLITGKLGKSLIVLIFAATSPVFVYYQSGFLPSIPSLANAIIGIYFFTRHLQSDSRKEFLLSTLFLTLAALSRTTFLIPLIAVFGIELFRILKKQTAFKDKIAPVIISLSAIIGYALYNGYLRSKYGSMFLNHFLPARDANEANKLISAAIENWGLQYFTIFHYVFFVLILLTSIFFIIKKRKSLPKPFGWIWVLLFATFSGAIIFSFLMLQQFTYHDYYFLDTYYLPIILLVLALITPIPDFETSKGKIGLGIVIFLTFMVMLVIVRKEQGKRREILVWDKITATNANFRNAQALVSKLRIDEDAKMLVIDANAPNIPFLHLDRKGFAVMASSRENIVNALKWDYDYVVFQNDFFVQSIYSKYPEIISKLDYVGDNGKITICKPSVVNKEQTLMGLLGYADKNPFMQYVVNFDSAQDRRWENIIPTSQSVHSGSFAGLMSSSNEYGPTFKLRSIDKLTKQKSCLLFSAHFKQSAITDCEVVVSIKTSSDMLYYKAYRLVELLKKKNEWEKCELLFNIPQINKSDFEFAVFIWNRGNDNVYIDDLSFQIY